MMRWGELVRRFLLGLTQRHYCPSTVDRYRYWLSNMADFAQSQELQVVDVSREVVDAWGAQLLRLGYSDDTRYQGLGMVRGFFRWVRAEGLMLVDPVGHLVLPHVDHPERVCPTPEAMQHLLELPDRHTLTGLRDYTVMAMLYGTGVRVSECEALDVEDLDFRQGSLRVRQAKGGVGRVLPVGDRLLDDVDDWLKLGRPRYGRRRRERALFLTFLGQRLGLQSIRKMVRRYGKAAGLGAVGPHLLRHAYGTHLLQAGAPVEDVQQLLGHQQLRTTQTYTHVTPEELRRLVERTHPRSRHPRS